MSKIKRFEDIKAWKEARALVVFLKYLTADYGLRTED